MPAGRGLGNDPDGPRAADARRTAACGHDDGRAGEAAGLVEPGSRAATDARAGAWAMGSTPPAQATTPRRARGALGNPRARQAGIDPPAPGPLGRDDAGAAPPVARERTCLPSTHARRTRQGQRRVPQVPVTATRRTARTARALAFDVAATATAPGPTGGSRATGVRGTLKSPTRAVRPCRTPRRRRARRRFSPPVRRRNPASTRRPRSPVR